MQPRLHLARIIKKPKLSRILFICFWENQNWLTLIIYRVISLPFFNSRIVPLGDYEFAQKYNLPIVQVVQTKSGATIADQALEEKGILMNSLEYNGLTSEAAFEKISETLSISCDGEVKTNYRLRDWGISRQRYWGCPIPMIHCQDCGNLPVPIEELPVELPEIDDITSKGLSLSGFTDWQKTSCPKCSKPALLP